MLSGMVRGSQSIVYSNKHRTYSDPKFDQVKRDNDRLRQQIEELMRNKDAKDSAELEQVARNEALRKDLANPFTPRVLRSPPSGVAVPPAPVLPSGAPDYRLSVERIKAHCDSHNIILVTFVNSKRANYAYTWASHLMRLRLTNYMVGAMDGEALVKLTKRNITAFDMAAGLTTADYGWGTKNFRQLGLRKSELIITLLKAGADPIVTDADALITRDPTPYILRYGKGADILVTSDQCAPAPPPPHRHCRGRHCRGPHRRAATAAPPLPQPSQPPPRPRSRLRATCAARAAPPHAPLHTHLPASPAAAPWRAQAQGRQGRGARDARQRDVRRVEHRLLLPQAHSAGSHATLAAEVRRQPHAMGPEPLQRRAQDRRAADATARQPRSGHTPFSRLQPNTRHRYPTGAHLLQRAHLLRPAHAAARAGRALLGTPRPRPCRCPTHMHCTCTCSAHAPHVQVHTTFQYSGAVGKLHRLREAHLWEDPPEYFAPQKGLLAFAPKVRRELIRPSGTMDVASHFQLVHEQLVQARRLPPSPPRCTAACARLHVHGMGTAACARHGHGMGTAWQRHGHGLHTARTPHAAPHRTARCTGTALLQVRAAFLLAERLGRLLVLPKLVCGLDRFWAPHNGTIPGSDTSLPIDPCPADHVLDLERMAGMLPKEKGGLEGVLREYSFLEHPMLPAAVRTDVKQLAPPASLGDASLRPLLELKATRVLNLTHMPDLYATLPADEAEAVQRRMREWTSIWCCSLPLTKKAAGHVWYDFFWDVVPHTDRHKKLWPAPWAVTFGP